MRYTFEMLGGVRKPTEYTVEKFLLFFIVGGEEVPAYLLKKAGVLLDSPQVGFNPVPLLATDVRYGKLFIAEQGFGIPKRHISLFFEFMPTNPTVTIKPFNPASKFVFRAKIKFMKRKDVLVLITNPQSRMFVERQPVMPVDVIKSLITVDQTERLKNVRTIRFRS